MSNNNIILYFTNEEKLMDAIDETKKYNIEIVDIISPYSVENMNIINNKGHRIGIISFVFAIVTLITTLCFQWWVNVIDYPQNIGGKPFISWVFSIPVTYELTLLFAAIGAFIGFLIFTKLPKWREVNDDRYAMNDDFILVFNQGDAEERILENIDYLKVKRTS